MGESLLPRMHVSPKVTKVTGNTTHFRVTFAPTRRRNVVSFLCTDDKRLQKRG